MAVKITKTDTGRGPLLGAVDEATGNAAHVFLPDAMPNGVEDTAARLFAGFTIVAGETERLNATMLPAMVPPALMNVIYPTLGSPYAGFVESVGVAARANKKTVADLATVPPSTAATAAVRSRAGHSSDLAPTDADRIRLGMTFDLPKMYGLVEINAFDVLPADAQDAIMDRYLTLNYGAKYGIASKHPAIATPDCPIPNGIDQDAVTRECEKMIKAIRENTKQIENCSQIARDAILFVALICACPVSQAFSLLTTGKV
jgi:hypothetical protein